MRQVEGLRAFVRAFAALTLAGALVVGGCTSVSVRTTGAATVEDLAAEDHYNATYATRMAHVQAGIALLAPSGSNPGVCNAGGNKQGCFDADLALIESLKAMSTALEAIPIPPRFVDSDRMLRDAIDENIRGIELRNRALSENDDALWDEHSAVLAKAISMMQDAYTAFPEDNRPLPPP